MEPLTPLTLTANETRRAVRRVKMVVQAKSYVLLFAVTAVHLVLLRRNYLGARSEGWPPGVSRVAFFGWGVSSAAYSLVCLGVLSYVTLSGLAVMVVKYRRLSRAASNAYAACNVFVGCVTLLLLSGIDVEGGRHCSQIWWNNAFFLSCVVIGCLKRGFDYNLKRLERPEWTGGNIFSSY